MKRLALILTLALSAVTASAAGRAQDLQVPRGDALADTTILFPVLDHYLESVDRLEDEAACAEVDFIISSVLNKELRDAVAVRTYRHFRDSKVMGSETVAIHIYDAWFASFKAVFPSLDEFDREQMHAFVNRASLFGRKAPELVCVTENLDTLRFFSGTKGCKPRPAVLFFYTADCPKCLFSAHELRRMLNEKPLKKTDVILVYVGDEKEKWLPYVERNLSIRERRRMKVHNLCPADDDFVISYGVVQTPRLFYMSGDGIILGRNLDAPALEQLVSRRK